MRRNTLARSWLINSPVSSKGLFVVGLMSGTSADGIDAVVAQFSNKHPRLKARVVAHAHRAFEPALRKRILHAGLHGTVAEICELNFLLGEHFARAALNVVRKAGLRPSQITAIGSHGQTVHHLPNARNPSTMQIGEAAVIAERTGILTISDFRVRDMAAGGQGAPLVPFADWALFSHPTRPRIIQNIGGIANLTFLPPNAALNAVVAFDTGPGNMVIDAIVSELSASRQSYDREGRWAARGEVCEALLAEMMTHHFMLRRPPKTTGREEFGEPFVRKVLASARQLRLAPADIVTTATAFTAVSIAESCQRFVLPKLRSAARSKLQIVLGGGGARNTTLVRMLRARLPHQEFLTHEALGVAAQAKEALAFALLAYETLHGRPGNVPRATGARHPAVLGKVTPAG